MNSNKALVSLMQKSGETSYEVEVFLNKDEGSFSYVEKDEHKTFTSFDYMNNVLKRDNNSMYMEYDFNNSKGYILVKDLSKKMEIPLQVDSIKKTSESIIIKYYINDEFYEYKMLTSVK